MFPGIMKQHMSVSAASAANENLLLTSDMCRSKKSAGGAASATKQLASLQTATSTCSIVSIGSSSTRLHNIVGGFMIKAHGTLILAYKVGRSKDKVPPESETSPECDGLFLGPLAAFPEHFVEIRCFVFWKQADRYACCHMTSSAEVNI